jgi:S1-C subfamily serine protease
MRRKIIKGIGVLMVGALLAVALAFGTQLYTAKAQASAIEDAKNATVFLLACSGKRCSTGTGFVVKQDSQGSFIVTNKHVCLSALASLEERRAESGVLAFRPLGVKRRDGANAAAQIIRVGQNSDLCLIRTDLKFKATLKLANSVTKDEQLFTYGFPAGQAELNKGKYQGTEGMQGAYYSKTDAKCWYGASGSAIMNVDGDVVGVIAMVLSKDKSKKKEDVVASFFIPLEILREFIGGR